MTDVLEVGQSNDLVGEIAAMAQAKATRRVENVGPTTRLVADLGIDGADARAFMDALAENYGVSLGGMRWRRYFGEEGFDPLAPALVFWLRRLDRDFGLRWRQAESVAREVSIAHLARVTEAKRWLDPDVSARPPSREPRTVHGFIGAALLSLLPIFLVAIMPAMLALFLLAPLWSGDWSVVTRNLWLVAFMAGLAAWQVWIARNSWRAIERKLDAGVEI